MALARIFIADPDEILRHAIGGVVSSHPGWEVCGESGGGSDALEKVATLQPDVVLLDMGLAGWGGVDDLARAILQTRAGQRIVVLGTAHVESVADEVFASGALAYVYKPNSHFELAQAITSVLEGRTFFTPRIAESLLNDYLHGGRRLDSQPANLSDHQRLALKLLAREVALSLDSHSRRRRGLHPAFKYLGIAVIVIISAVLTWPYYHQALERQLPLVNKWLVKAGVKDQVLPETDRAGNPDTRVWIDLQTGLYYCPGSDAYRKTARGRLAKQRDAQLDHFEPAGHSPCN